MQNTPDIMKATCQQCCLILLRPLLWKMVWPRSNSTPFSHLNGAKDALLAIALWLFSRRLQPLRGSCTLQAQLDCQLGQQSPSIYASARFATLGLEVMGGVLILSALMLSISDANFGHWSMMQIGPCSPSENMNSGISIRGLSLSGCRSSSASSAGK